MPEPALIVSSSDEASEEAAILVTGGAVDDWPLQASATVETFPPSCSPPQLDTERRYHLTFSHQDQIFSCGGIDSPGDFLDNCVVLNLETQSWVNHSQLTTKGRWYSSYAVIDGLPCIIGGSSSYGDAAHSIECLTGNSWSLLPDSIPGGGVDNSCSAPTPGGGLLILGGEYAGTQVIERLSSGTWDVASWPQLDQGRKRHSCATYDSSSKLMVTGGVVGVDSMDNPLYVTSTLIIDLTTKTIADGPDMLHPRAYHATVTLGDRIYVLAGYSFDWDIQQAYYRTSIELYEDSSIGWVELEETLMDTGVGKWSMGFSRVTLSSIGC